MFWSQRFLAATRCASAEKKHEIMNKYLIQVIFGPFIRKRLFGKEFIRFNEFHNQSYIISEYCLTLGYLYRNNFETFAKLISEPNADLNKVSSRIAKMGESLYENHYDINKGTYDLFINSQEKRYNELLNMKNSVKVEFGTEAYLKSENKLPTFIIPKLTDLLSYSFIGFGYQYPDLAEKIFNRKFDDKLIENAIEDGLNITNENLTINDRIISTKELIKPYVEKYKPELLTELHLD